MVTPEPKHGQHNGHQNHANHSSHSMNQQMHNEHADHNMAGAPTHDMPMDHSKHQAASSHTEHGQHAGHTGHEKMFRSRFWGSLILSIPVLLFSPMIQEWLGFSVPSFPGSAWIPFIFPVPHPRSRTFMPGLMSACWTSLRLNVSSRMTHLSKGS